MNEQIIGRFMRDTKAGAQVWYVLDDRVKSGFLLYEPNEEGRPWTWISNAESAEKLLLFAPQATRVWFIPGDIGTQFMQREGLSA